MYAGKNKGVKMETVAKLVAIAGVSGVMLVLSGCAMTSVATEKPPFDIKKQHILKHYEDVYYYRPNQSWSYKLDANSANLNNVASGGLLNCKEDDIWFRSIQDGAEEEKIRYRYMISLSKSQLEDMKDDPTFIPRRDSKEFKDLIEIDTQMAQQNLIGCSSEIPKEQVEKIMPVSDVIAIPSL